MSATLLDKVKGLRKEFYSIPEVAVLISSGRWQVVGLIERGLLTAYKIGGRIKVRATDFEEFLAKSKVQPVPAIAQ